VTLKKYLLFNAGFVNKLAEVESYFSNFLDFDIYKLLLKHHKSVVQFCGQN
jgi:hypothetical protein